LVDRIQIEADRFRTRNSNGDVTFDSNDKYVKTQTGGNFEFGGYKRLPVSMTLIYPSSGQYAGVYLNQDAAAYLPQQNFQSNCGGSYKTYNAYGNYYGAWFGVPPGFGNSGLWYGNIETYVGPGNSITAHDKSPRTPGNELVLFFPIGMDSYTFEEMPMGVSGSGTNLWCSTNGSSLHNFTGTCDDTGDTYDINFGIYTYPSDLGNAFYSYARGTYRLSTSTLNSLVGSGRTIRATFPDVRSTAYKWHPRSSTTTTNFSVDYGNAIRSAAGVSMMGWAHGAVILKVYGNPVNLGLAVTA